MVRRKLQSGSRRSGYIRLPRGEDETAEPKKRYIGVDKPAVEYKKEQGNMRESMFSDQDNNAADPLEAGWDDIS